MRKVKDFLPFIFPLAAIVLVMILAVRWYRLRNDQVGQISEFAEGVEIENLTESERDKVIKGASEGAKTDLQKTNEKDDIVGEVRYELSEGKVLFTVNADLPILDAGMYQVWLKDPKSESIKKAFVLEETKGGYTGSAAIAESALPFEVVVTREKNNDDAMEEVVLRGTIEKMDKSK
jgi:hypothetical protein